MDGGVSNSRMQRAFLDPKVPTAEEVGRFVVTQYLERLHPMDVARPVLAHAEGFITDQELEEMSTLLAVRALQSDYGTYAFDRWSQIADA